MSHQTLNFQQKRSAFLVRSKADGLLSTDELLNAVLAFLSSTSADNSGKLGDKRGRTTGGGERTAKKERDQMSRILGLLDPHFLQGPHHYICFLPIKRKRKVSLFG